MTEVAQVLMSEKGTESAIDLTLPSDSLTGVYSWEMARRMTVGSDFYRIVTEVGVNVEEYDIGGLQK